MNNKKIPFVSLIILNWNGFDQTKEGIDSALKQAYPPEAFEIIVVDNGSTPEELNKLKEFIDKRPTLKTAVAEQSDKSQSASALEDDPGKSLQQSADLLSTGLRNKITIILNKENLGFAEGNNVVMRWVLEEGRADIIALVNNDIVLSLSWLQEMVKPFSEPSVGATAGQMIMYKDKQTIENTGHQLLLTGDVIPRDRGLSVGVVGNRPMIGTNLVDTLLGRLQTDMDPTTHHSSLGEVMGVCAGAACYRVKALKKVGLFYPDFFANYEDADLGLRLITTGYKCAYVPGATCLHHHNSSIKKVRNPAFMLRSLVNAQKAFWYNVPIGALIFDLPFVLLKDIIALLGFLLTGQFSLFSLFIKSRFVFWLDLPLTLKRRAKVQGLKAPGTSWYYLTHQTYFSSGLFKQLLAILLRKSSLKT